MSTDGERVYVVDRIEGGVAILEGLDGRFREVLASVLPPATRGGTVLRIKIDSEGHPDWTTARIEEAKAEERISEAEEILDELRSRDPGGDIEL